MLLPCSRHWLDMFRSVLKGENLHWPWEVGSSDVSTWARLLLWGVVVDKPRLSCGVMRWLVWIYGHCYSLLIVDLNAWCLFLFPHLDIILVLYYFVICWWFSCVSMLMLTMCILPYAEAGCVQCAHFICILLMLHFEPTKSIICQNITCVWS